MDQSQASLLLSSKKFHDKAQEMVKEGLEAKPQFIQLEKAMGGAAPSKVTLEDAKEGNGGMMLYTSGTTNRPVGIGRREHETKLI